MRQVGKVEQARRNLENEIPDGTTLEDTATRTRTEWTEKLDRIQVKGATDVQKTIFYTAVFHTLQVRVLKCLCIFYSMSQLIAALVSI